MLACQRGGAGPGLFPEQDPGRCTATAAFSELANLPSPDKHPLVLTYRKLSFKLRTKTFRCGRTGPVLRGHIPVLGADRGFASSPRGPPAPRRGGRAGPSPGTRNRKRAATAAHIAVLHDGVLHCDDDREGQLGNFSLYPEAVEIGVFGSKADPLPEDKSAQMPSAEGARRPSTGRRARGPSWQSPGRGSPACGPPWVGLPPSGGAARGLLPSR